MNVQELEALGITKDELLDRVVDKISHNALTAVYCDENGNPWEDPSPFYKMLQEKVMTSITTAIDEIAGQHVFPSFTDCIEAICFQATNNWGEPKGEPITFKEYLTQRAEAYMHEKVDFEGKSKADGGHNWHGKQTRLTYLVHNHLQYNIDSALKAALADINSDIAKAITETVGIALKTIVSKFRTTITSR